MDEESKIVEIAWQQVDITANDFILRSCHKLQSKKESSRRFPNESCFSTREGEDSLSVNLGRFANEMRSSIVLGLRFNRNGDFIDIKQFDFFKFPIDIIQALKGCDKIIHTPSINGNPADIGNPNNKSHSSLFMDDELQFRVNISDYARKHIDKVISKVNAPLLDQHLVELKSKGNQTPYHKDWKFENDPL